MVPQIVTRGPDRLVVFDRRAPGLHRSRPAAAGTPLALRDHVARRWPKRRARRRFRRGADADRRGVPGRQRRRRTGERRRGVVGRSAGRPRPGRVAARDRSWRRSRRPLRFRAASGAPRTWSRGSRPCPSASWWRACVPRPVCARSAMRCRRASSPSATISVRCCAIRDGWIRRATDGGCGPTWTSSTNGATETSCGWVTSRTR